MAREELKWQNVDADDLPAEVKRSFDAMVEAEAAFKADLEKLLKNERTVTVFTELQLGASHRILSLPPGLRAAIRVTEIARREASVEPSHETVDVVDRNPELIAQRARIGHHVRTLKQDGSDASVLLHELAAGIDDVSLGGGNVHGE